MTPIQLNRFQQGLDLFNAGEFYDCHEVLEELWNDLSGNEKKTVQGILQVAVGFYHLRTGNLNGTRNLFRKALDIFWKYPAPNDFPLSTLPLQGEIRVLSAKLQRLETLSPALTMTLAPTLRLTPTSSG